VACDVTASLWQLLYSFAAVLLA